MTSLHDKPYECGECGRWYYGAPEAMIECPACKASIGQPCSNVTDREFHEDRTSILMQSEDGRCDCKLPLIHHPEMERPSKDLNMHLVADFGSDGSLFGGFKFCRITNDSGPTCFFMIGHPGPHSDEATELQAEAAVDWWQYKLTLLSDQKEITVELCTTCGHTRHQHPPLPSGAKTCISSVRGVTCSCDCFVAKVFS